MTTSGAWSWPEMSDAHRMAKLYDIVAGLTRGQPFEVQARILAVGGAPEPYITERQADGRVSLTVALADGTTILLGYFDPGEMDEPLLDGRA